MAVVLDRYTAYDPFAWLYNRHWKGQFHPAAIAVMEAILLPRLPKGARILDLCCGPGWLADILSKRGYGVTGLDGSAEMLRYARETAPGVELILGDARSFSLPGSYDAVISVFDSLNHILLEDQLTATFRCAYDSLAAGGRLFFDLNTASGFGAKWRGVFAFIEDDHVCAIRTGYEPQTALASWEATLLRLEEGAWRRSDFSLTQRCYAVTQVKAALGEAGFLEVEAFAYDRAAGLTPLSEASPRAFFLCRKPPVP